MTKFTSVVTRSYVTMDNTMYSQNMINQLTRTLFMYRSFVDEVAMSTTVVMMLPKSSRR